MTGWKISATKIKRDTILFAFGLAGIGYETIFEHSEKPTLLVLFGAMIGLPAFLHKDEANKKDPPAEKKDPPDDKPTP